MTDSALAPVTPGFSENALSDSELIVRLREQIASQAAELTQREVKIQALTFELAYYKRLRYARASEQLWAEQMPLFNDAVDEDLAAIEIELKTLCSSPRAARTRGGRMKLPKSLPRIEHRHEPESCQCAQCGQALVPIGEDISEQWDVEPARFFVHRHIRPQYACRQCETVSAAPVLPSLIEGGLAAPGLHAWVLIQKYQDHLPLYRIEQISARYGVPIARSTLAQWVGQLGVALQPLTQRLAEHLRQRTVLHADETPIRQLAPGKGKTDRAYCWAYRSVDLDPTGPPIIVFDYPSSRAGVHPQNFLHDWRAHLMVDDYAGYKALFSEQRIELGCLAHARRKFFDLFSANAHPIAQQALERIARLYAIEETARALDIQARYALRQRESRPLLEALHHWLREQHARAAPGGALHKAISYSLKRWPALSRYADSGLWPIDNNPIENAIRPLCVGKKNWLFTGSERAGQRAAQIQTLLGTAQLNGIEPYAWLTQTLERLPTWPNRRIDELLPLRAPHTR